MEVARTIKIFDKEISIRKYGCKNFLMKEPLYIEKPRINIFVQVTNYCNANCPFCIYHHTDLGKDAFNLKKFEEILNYFVSREDIDIGKLNFTGGEPVSSQYFDDIICACMESLDYTRKPEVTLNTNGLNLDKIIKYQDFLDNVGLSRHHYQDNKNYEIFRDTSIASGEDIKEMMSCIDDSNKWKMQLRCNLINGYICNYDAMIKYLEHAIELGVHDCGFVTLAPNNKFCVEHQIDFNSLVKISENLIKTNGWKRLDDNNHESVYCECANYMYSNKVGEICKFYARLFCNNDNIDSILVYDGQYLRHGFGGRIIL